ncbi:organic cation/carnitine transporter 2-like [Dunckerocampus dactyliophorus]|uniref:organic cation/carnitine transporter 2-like n=1 Tax=Dunckerocampus dactyliophorus TaxID=161453 RepID=UPI0024075FB8|nr:organic cation/carnitine transporter 2-like [Dunckerocampus dactyliophorus]
MKTYPESIAFLGQFGRFQQMVFFLLCISIVPNGFGAFTLVFLADTPSHHCRVPDVNLTEDWRSAIIPVRVVNGKPVRSSCSRYRLDVVRNLSDQGYSPDHDVNLTTLEEETCKDGWIYSKDVYQSTIVTEFDLVCNDKWKKPFTTTIFFVGILVGSFFAGQLSDKCGRKPVLFVTLALQTIFTFIQVFSVSWLMFTVLLVINGLGQMSNYMAALVLGAEILTGNVRLLYSSLGTCFGFAAGYMLLPLCAYFVRDWKTLLLVLSVPCLAFFPFWWFIPESPRWLLCQDRVEEAEAIVKKAAKINKVQAPGAIFEGYNVAKAKTDPKEPHSILDLVRNVDIAAMTVVLCYVAFTISAGYYGISFNTTQLHDNTYVSCFISGAVELPAYVSSWLALRYIPRRLSVIATLVLAAIPLYLMQLVPEGYFGLSLLLEMVGKYAITTGFGLMFAYTTELYPTALRNTAAGICNTVARLGSCIMPYLLELRSYSKFLPYIILGSLAVLAAFATIFLPESFGRPLPDTMRDMRKRERINCPCLPKAETPVAVLLMDNPKA